MNILHDLERAALRQETNLTIGAFDGVHLGHQALIGEVVSRARATDRLAVVLTFHPHPAAVLGVQRAPQVLTTLGEKLALFEGLQVDLVVLLPFDRQLAAKPAADFLYGVSTHLRTRELWVGPDFALGHNREGTIPRLRELGQELGFRVHVAQPLTLGDGTIVSSSKIRAFLAEGMVDRAAALLGRFPSLSGEVVKGAMRGRRLGFPTANLEVRPERAVPADGVYAVIAQLGVERHAGVANVGVRPSFDRGPRTVETHILDFDQDIYGCDLKVEFVARLRAERRFEDPADLVAQIQIDSQEARHILRGVGLGGPAGPQCDLPFGGQQQSGCPFGYEEVEHTADRALRVWGRDLGDLFVGAAQGMVHLMADLDGLPVTHWRTIFLEAADRESLLVRWLNELLFLAETEDMLFLEYQIVTSTDTRFEARVGGIVSEVTKAHIKAATFHDLRLEQDDCGWSCTITFDM